MVMPRDEKRDHILVGRRHNQSHWVIAIIYVQRLPALLLIFIVSMRCTKFLGG